MDAEERRDRRVDARQLHRDKTVEEHGAPGSAVSLVSDPANSRARRSSEDLAWGNLSRAQYSSIRGATSDSMKARTRSIRALSLSEKFSQIL